MRIINKPSFNLSELQEDIMRFVDKWAKEEKTPIPKSEIISRMNGEGIKSYTTINAIKVLLRRGYIRKSIMRSNKTYYIQLRRV